LEQRNPLARLFFVNRTLRGGFGRHWLLGDLNLLPNALQLRFKLLYRQGVNLLRCRCWLIHRRLLSIAGFFARLIVVAALIRRGLFLPVIRRIVGSLFGRWTIQLIELLFRVGLLRHNRPGRQEQEGGKGDAGEKHLHGALS
jgi:hypothetical protein